MTSHTNYISELLADISRSIALSQIWGEKMGQSEKFSDR